MGVEGVRSQLCHRRRRITQPVTEARVGHALACPRRTASLPNFTGELRSPGQAKACPTKGSPDCTVCDYGAAERHAIGASGGQREVTGQNGERVALSGQPTRTKFSFWPAYRDPNGPFLETGKACARCSLSAVGLPLCALDRQSRWPPRVATPWGHPSHLLAAHSKSRLLADRRPFRLTAVRLRLPMQLLAPCARAAVLYDKPRCNQSRVNDEETTLPMLESNDLQRSADSDTSRVSPKFRAFRRYSTDSQRDKASINFPLLGTSRAAHRPWLAAAWALAPAESLRRILPI